MVDITNIKDSFMFAVVFVAIFALIVSLGVADAPELFESSETQFYPTPPEYFNAADIEDLATFYNITADNGGSLYIEYWGIDEGFGHHFYFQANDAAGVELRVEHYSVLWLIVEIGYDYHLLEWFDAETGQSFGETLTDAEFDSIDIWDADTGISSAKFRLKCDHLYLYSTVAYNGTAYVNATAAFWNDALTVMFAISWDELGTGLNAYNLISQIMTFQRPDIHPAINSLIAIPLWALMGFIVVVIILAVIEALPFT